VLRSLIVLAALALAVPLTVLAASGPEPAADAARALPAPRLSLPENDVNVQSAPIFTWNPVRRAVKYEFQLSADSGFRSIVTGGTVDTFNKAFTLEHSLPDGDYHWRVRAVNASNDAGRWSAGRSFTKRWSTRPTLLSPTGETVVNYPNDPFLLRWEPVPNAVKYVVTLAADPGLATQILGTANNPVETVGTAFSPQGSLPPGQYWWAITPINAVGNRGARSVVGSFIWQWPSSTALQVTDLNADPRVYDPQFSWDRVPGAAQYEVEVNSSQDFAVGSKVCCTDKTIGTSLSPTKVFPNNTYYWRVRAVDADDASGVWNVGTPFQKTFDPVEPYVPGLALRDNVGPLPTGSATSSPIVRWDPVPGAASYDVEVVPFVLVDCDWGASSGSSWRVSTATTAWTALANGGSTPAPPHNPATEGDKLGNNSTFCVRVRARTGTSTNNNRVVSEWSYIGGPSTAAFTYNTPPGPVSTTEVTAADSDYLLPAGGSQTGATPLFTWKHITGACGYFVVVAKDAEFTTIVDVARTKIPAYAPRPDTYPDETTSYYWAVVPVVGTSCSSVFSVIDENNPHNFRKESTPPQPVGPTNGAEVGDQPVFRWSAAEGARDYRLQVAHDSTFLNLVDDVVTASTAYTSSSTYPADALLYWRVRANDENNIGLKWSATQTFRRRLPAPVVGANPDADERIPILSWNSVPGAVSYDISIEEPDGDNNLFSDLFSTVAVPTKAYGLGVWQWRVRANFPTSNGVAPGPFSPRRPFTRYMNPPTGARITRDNGGLVLRWDPSFGLAKQYKVEFSENNSFRTTLENKRVDNAGFAPTMTSSGFQNGGPVYWRVAAVDEGGNVGGWASGRVGLLRKMVVRANGILRRGSPSVLEVRVLNARNRPVRRARVTLRGVGVRARKRTSKKGIARFRVRPRARGNVRVRADKRGFRPGAAVLPVR
jgi:hypothetical protein